MRSDSGFYKLEKCFKCVCITMDFFYQMRTIHHDGEESAFALKLGQEYKTQTVNDTEQSNP